MRGREITGVSLALLFAWLSMSTGGPTLADGVCGDGIVNAPEQCDDGNRADGDGCSSQCIIDRVIEVTRTSPTTGALQSGTGLVLHAFSVSGSLINGQPLTIKQLLFRLAIVGRFTVGNWRLAQSGSAITVPCTLKQESGLIVCTDIASVATLPVGAPLLLELRADVTVPPDTVNAGLQIDLAGLEGVPQSGASSSSSSAGGESTPPMSPQTIIHEAENASAFLAHPNGAPYVQSLGGEQTPKLGQILQKLGGGHRLTTQERGWAGEIGSTLERTKARQRKRSTDLLRKFIGTPISADVVSEKKLEKGRLVDVDLPVAIGELQRRVRVLHRKELREKVLANVERLHRQGITIENSVPPQYEKNLSAGSKPIEVFATLQSLKEATERYATDDVPASLAIVRSQAAQLRAALPVLQREYGVQPEEIDVFLRDIEQATREATKQDAYPVVLAVNRFLSTLEERKMIRPSDLTAAPDPQRTAAEARRIGKEIGGHELSLENGSIRSFITNLTVLAPEKYRRAFVEGSTREQCTALVTLLTEDERIRSLQIILRDSGQAAFDHRFEELKHQILAVGSPSAVESPCSASVSEALRCSAAYLQDLQSAVRSRSLFSRIIGFLQDFFGIGS